MISNTQELVASVAAHAGIRDDRVDRVVAVVLSAIGAHLSPAQRGYVADELPPPLDAEVVHAGGLSLPIEERVVACGVGTGLARELIASVCRVLADRLSAEALGVLSTALPAELAALLVPGSAGFRPPPARHAPTLAEGRAGAQRPLAEGTPSPGHAGSIAADNPHADTKLSSAAGATQERLHDTLAEGHPQRPLSRSRG